MRLPKPFYRLPVHFDVERMRAEVAALSQEAWAKHPNGIPGNSSVRLVSVGGGDNDLVDGPMSLTRHLEGSPYLCQVLASFGVVWSRSRLLRLAPGADVPPHSDINYHWFYRVRVHVPIITSPPVRFSCGDETVHMAAGEAWVFDNWRRHSVVNPTDQERIHLVADTSGTAAFWQQVMQSDIGSPPEHRHRYDRNRQVHLLTERTALRPVMLPAELELLLFDLRSELIVAEDRPETHKFLAQYHAILDFFAREWRQLYALYGEDIDSRDEFRKLRDYVRQASRAPGEGLITGSNLVSAHAVLEGRILRACVPEAVEEASKTDSSSAPNHGIRHSSRAATKPEQPIFIVAAPRSGSTLLFETLASSHSVGTLGGEAHWLIESIPELCPGAPGVDSNRLEAAAATDSVEREICRQIAANIVDHNGRAADPHKVRFLEKTPKNALRIPFLARLFPDALFIFLWRDPRENISSIIEAWRAGRWCTYPWIEGFELPWSLLLPPDWQSQRGKPLEHIAAFQWNRTNQLVLDDLARLPPGRYSSLRYDELVSSPGATIRRLCAFASLDFDSGLAARVASPLPHARHTLTAPAAQKWKSNARLIDAVLPDVSGTWHRLRQLDPHAGTNH